MLRDHRVSSESECLQFQAKSEERALAQRGLSMNPARQEWLTGWANRSPGDAGSRTHAHLRLAHWLTVYEPPPGSDLNRRMREKSEFPT